MTLRVLLLGLSLALNATLLAAFVLRPSLAPPALRPYLAPRSTAPAPTPSRTPSDAKPAASAAPAEIWSKLHSTELATLVARLRAAGFPPALVRAIVDAEVERQFSPRIKELLRTMTETPYWKPDPSYYSGNSKLFEEINQIYRERSRAVRELVGRDAFAWGGNDPSAAQRRQFGNLTQAKVDLVQRVNDDYEEMMSQVRVAMQGITLPEDREKLALLEREKRADLAAILTPEELADYEMRTSQITMRLRTAVTIMDATEAEFRSIYKIHESHKDALYPNNVTFFSSDMMEKRREAGKQVLDQVKAALGDARFADYQRANDSDFQQLVRLGQRDNVPQETLLRAYQVRQSTNEAANKLYQDNTLSAEAKHAAAKDLAAQARTQLLGTLGPAAGPAYADNARWLTYLDRGYMTTVNPDGTTSSRSIASTPPPATPAPKK